MATPMCMGYLPNGARKLAGRRCSPSRRLVETDDLACQTRRRGWVGFRHPMVVSWNDQVTRARELPYAPVTLEHPRQIVEDGERALVVDFFKHVHGIGGEDDPAPGGVDPHDG